jgi:hypothetical protein
LLHGRSFSFSAHVIALINWSPVAALEPLAVAEPSAKTTTPSAAI